MHAATAAERRHAHVFLGRRHDAHARRTRAVVALTAVMMVVEIAAGWWTGSMALLADGFHMATHAGALGIAALAYGFASRHAEDPRFTFGTGKVGDLAGFASALLLAATAVAIAVESGTRLFAPRPIAFDEALWIAVAGLAVNVVSARLLCDHDHEHGDGHHHHDNNLRSAYLHVLADALTSVFAILALLAGRALGWVRMDAVSGIVGAIVIARWSWTLLRDTGAVLVDASADPLLAAEIRSRIEDGDARVNDLHVWQVGPGHFAAIVALTAATPHAPAVYAQRLSTLRRLAHVTIEAQPCDCDHP